MAGFFLLSLTSPYMYHMGREYYESFLSRPPLLQDFIKEEREDNSDEKNENSHQGLLRSDSEYSLGLSHSQSFNDIGRTNYNSLGICTTGKITYEIMKYCGSTIMIILILWKITELTKPLPKYK